MPTPVNIADINVIMEDVGGFLSLSSQSEPRLQENFRNAELAAQKVESLLTDLGDAAATIERQKGIAGLQAQKATELAALYAGVKQGAEYDTINRLMSDIHIQRERVAKATQEVQKKWDSKFIDDPVQWVVNGLTVKASEKKVEREAKTEAILTNQLAQLNSAIQSVAQTQQVLKPAITQGTIEAATRVAATEALVKAQTARLEGIKYNTQSVEAMKNASKERLDVLFGVQRSVAQQEQFKLALAEASLSNARFGLAVHAQREANEDRDANRALREADDKLDEQIIATINKGNAILGRPLMTGQAALTRLKLSRKTGTKEFDALYALGLRSEMTGVNMFGNTPAEALEIISNMSPNLAPAVQDTVKRVLGPARQALQDSKNPELSNPKNVEARANAINKRVEQDIATEYANIREGSVFDIGDISQYIDYPGTSNLPVVTKFLAPLAAEKISLNKPETVLKLLAGAVQKGDLTSSEAVDIATVYRKGSGMNQSARNFIGLGITVPENGKNYTIDTGFWAGNGMVDMMDPVSISRYLSLSMAKEMGVSTHPAVPGRDFRFKY